MTEGGGRSVSRCLLVCAGWAAGVLAMTWVTLRTMGLCERPPAVFGLGVARPPAASGPGARSRCDPGQALPSCRRERRIAADPGEEVCSPRVRWESTMQAWKDKMLAGNTTVAMEDPGILPLATNFTITKEMMERATYLGDAEPLRKVLQKTRNGTVSVDVIGGSFTAGVFSSNAAAKYGKNDWSWAPRDRWTARLQEQTLPWGFKIRNLARGATSTKQFLHKEDLWKDLRKSPPDLIIAELAVNDQVFPNTTELKPILEQMIGRMESLIPRPALLFVEAFRTSGFYPKDSKGGHCKRPNELTKWMPHPVWTTYSWCTHWWKVASVHQEVLRAHRLPYFSYRDMIWPKMEDPPPELPFLWNGLSHPDWGAHHLLAESLVRMLAKTNEEICLPEFRSDSATQSEPLVIARPPLLQSEPASAVLPDYCTSELLTEYNAENGPEQFRPAEALPESSVWRFFEDAVGKPGWIGDHATSASNDTLTISFDLEVGASKLIIIQFLQSYHSMGAALIWLDGGRDEALIIDAFSSDCVSVTETFTLHARPGNHRLFIQLLAARCLPMSTSRLDVFRGDKFKLLSISSC